MHFDNEVVVRTDIPIRGEWHILHSCGQTAGWMKTPLGTEVDLGAGNIVLDRFPALRERGTAPPLIGPCLLWLWPWSPISATAELLFDRLCHSPAFVVIH